MTRIEPHRSPGYAPRPDQVLLGLDLGCSADHSALAIAVQEFRPGGSTVHVTNLPRWPLMTSYPRVVEDVRRVAGQPWARPFIDVPAGRGAPGIDRLVADPPVLIADASGVGEAVMELVLQAEIPARVVPIRITAGAGCSEARWPGETEVDEHWHVAKGLLISALIAAIQSERMVIGREIPERDALIAEMQSFQSKLTAKGGEQYEGRVGSHDDMVMALSYIAWYVGRPAVDRRLYVRPSPLRGYRGRP